MKTTHEKGKASNGEFLVLYAVDDIYVPEYHVVRGMICRRFRNITASIFRIKGPKTVSPRRAMNYEQLKKGKHLSTKPRIKRQQ